ncbi:hypothetical protein C8R43DRAFT_1024232 [Mycena crocata]|nr:hypothetical protein C8R43DRAFT_1024232 [Mycena crocata]
METPSPRRITRNSTKSPGLALENSPGNSPTPSRKPPHCATCGKPRKGHPRNGCPFAKDGNQRETGSKSPTRNVSDALSALNLAANADTDDETEHTTQDGGFGAGAKKAGRLFTRMPGTLLTPTSSFMYSQSSQASCKDESPSALGASQSFDPYLGLSQLSDTGATTGDLTPRADSPDPPRATATRPLTRTLTSKERTEFTASLTNLTKATVYVLPAVDVPAICASATACGLSTRTLPLDHADALVVVGRTAAAVEVLFYQVEAKMHALVPPLPASGGALKMAVRTLFVTTAGAAAAWGVLAFS